MWWNSDHNVTYVKHVGPGLKPVFLNAGGLLAFIAFFILGIQLFLFAGCSDDGSGPQPTLTSTPTITPTLTPSLTVTPDPPLQYAIQFLEYSVASGIDIIEDGPHGLAIADVNGDDFDDIFITRCCSGMIDYLYVNQKDGTFREEGAHRGVSDPGSPDGGTHGALFLDVDDDGDYDLLSSGTGVPDRLYRNDGSGYFSDVTAQAGFTLETRFTRGVLAGDIDQDGDQDLYLASLACQDSIDYFENILMINQGDGTFLKDDGSRGLADDVWPDDEECFGIQGVTFGDVELDGDLDIYVNRINMENRLFINNGRGYFQEQAGPRGVTNERIFSNGAEFADLDGDGDLDLFVQDFDEWFQLKFFLNDGQGFFYDATSDYGLYSQAYSGIVADFDNDGDLDYYVIARGLQVEMIMLENDGSGGLTPVYNCGADFIKIDARSAAVTDYDNDGDLDIMLLANRGACNFLRNEANNNRFLKIKLVGPGGGAGAFGALVKIYQAGHLGDPAYFRGLRHAVSGQGYLAQNSPVVHFGLGNITQVADIEVIFSTGHIVHKYNIERGHFITIKADE